MAWPDGGTNEVTVSIGATARDHATMTLWEADTDEDCTAGWGAGIYAAACSPVGECYDDGDFTEGVYLYGATTDSTHYRRLTAAVGERHDGTAFSGGVEIVTQAAYNVKARENYLVVEWLLTTGSDGYAFCFYAPPAGALDLFRECVAYISGTVTFGGDNVGAGSEQHAYNCVAHGSSYYQFYNLTHCYNCSGLGIYYIFRAAGCQNCIAMRTTGSNTAYFTGCTGDYNIGDDTSAPGANSIDNIAAADIYANTGGGTEDLHLLTGATVANASGDNLFGTFTIDIDNETRPNAAFDIGADDFQAAAVGVARFKVGRNLARGSSLVGGGLLN